MAQPHGRVLLARQPKNPPDTTWVNLRDFLLVEQKKQTPKKAHCMVPFVWNFRTGQVRHAAETRAVPAYTGRGRDRTSRGDADAVVAQLYALVKIHPAVLRIRAFRHT